jgi:type IV secretory pathway TraG/TraD family ATPase VirD4
MPTGPCRLRRWKRTDAPATDQPAVRGLRRLRGADGEQRLAQGIFGYGEIATDIPFLHVGPVLFLAWRFNRRAANQHNDLLGSARFGDRADVRKLEGNGDPLIGRSAKSGKLLHYDSAAHLLAMAPTRLGKKVSAIIPNLLLLDRLVICIDPKGGNARVTARVRAAKGQGLVTRSVRRVGSAHCPL